MEKKRIEEIGKEIATLKKSFGEEYPPEGVIIHRQTFFYLLSTIEELKDERDGFKNGQIQLQNMVSGLMDSNQKWAQLEDKVRELVDALDALEGTRKRMKETEANLTRLLEAVERHKNFYHKNTQSFHPGDEALYRVAEGIRKERGDEKGRD